MLIFVNDIICFLAKRYMYCDFQIDYLNLFNKHLHEDYFSQTSLAGYEQFTVTTWHNGWLGTENTNHMVVFWNLDVMSSQGKLSGTGLKCALQVHLYERNLELRHGDDTEPKDLDTNSFACATQCLPRVAMIIKTN